MRKTWIALTAVCFACCAMYGFAIWGALRFDRWREHALRVEYPTQMLCGLSDDDARAVRQGKHARTGCPEMLRDVHAMENT